MENTTIATSSLMEKGMNPLLVLGYFPVKSRLALTTSILVSLKIQAYYTKLELLFSLYRGVAELLVALIQESILPLLIFGCFPG